MFPFVWDDGYEWPVQTKQKDKKKVIVQYQNEGGSTYGAYCICILKEEVSLHLFITKT